MLTTFYVDAHLVLTADRDGSGGISPGDQVTYANGQANQQADLTYDAAPAQGDVGTAFSSISQALNSPLVSDGDTIDIAAGDYPEAIAIDKSLSLVGFGQVTLTLPGSAHSAAITISGDPQSVSLTNLDVEGTGSLARGLSSDGAGTLNLTDVTLGIGGPTTVFADPLNSLSNVTNLNIVDTSGDAQTVNFDPGPPMGLTPFVSTNHLAITVQNVTNISVTTGSGSDTFDVSSIAKTITIDGGDPPPPAQPGDTLDMSLPTGAEKLSATHDNTGYRGTWTMGNGNTVAFSHIETLAPGVEAEGHHSFSATEGVSTGDVLLAQFVDPLANLPLADYSATIDWADSSTSAGTVSYDSASGLYSVTGSHVYGEFNGDDVKITVHRAGSPDTAIYATAVVSSAPQPPSGSSNPTTNERFVSAVYQQLLARPADSAGLSFWTNQLNSGVSRSQVVLAIEGSQEYRADEVEGFYHTYLGRDADPDSLSYDTAILAEGVPPEQVAAVILGSPEYFQVRAGGTIDGFVDALFHDVLHRAADPTARASIDEALLRGATRAQMADAVLSSHEYHVDLVQNIYLDLLGRGAEPGAADAWGKLLDAGQADAQVQALIVGSDEYFARVTT